MLITLLHLSFFLVHKRPTFYVLFVPGPPSCLALFYNDGGEDGDEVLYGTADGKVGLVQLTR